MEVVLLTADAAAERLSDAELEDIALFAEDDVRPFDEVLVEMWWQSDVLDLAYQLEQTEPGYLGYEIDWEAQTVTWTFAGDVPSTLIASPLRGYVNFKFVGGVDLTSVEFNGLVQRTLAQMQELGVPLSASIDQTRALAVVTIDADGPEEALQAIEAIAADIDEVDVVRGTPSVGENETYGGSILVEQSGDSTADCTSAFAAVRNGARGMTTAGHCDDFFDSNPDRHKNDCMSCNGYVVNSVHGQANYLGRLAFLHDLVIRG